MIPRFDSSISNLGSHLTFFGGTTEVIKIEFTKITLSICEGVAQKSWIYSCLLSSIEKSVTQFYLLDTLFLKPVVLAPNNCYRIYD